MTEPTGIAEFAGRRSMCVAYVVGAVASFALYGLTSCGYSTHWMTPGEAVSHSLIAIVLGLFLFGTIGPVLLKRLPRDAAIVIVAFLGFDALRRLLVFLSYGGAVWIGGR